MTSPLRSAKTIARQTLLHTVFRPPYVRHCSQTIYEALLGCCRMWESSGAAPWKARADRLVGILLDIQQPDGGFDIGYDFNFGRWHRKGQSTSPELVSLLALCEYARLFDRDRVAEPARRAVEWIVRHAQPAGDGMIAIPYSPHTIHEVMVYNGTSFACGALGRYLGEFGGSPETVSIYEGMVRYLNQVMASADGLPGRFWYYCDQSRDDWEPRRRDKIDYYHQMQQVEMHALAEQVSPVPEQIELIRDAADHIVALQARHPILPYTNDPANFKGQIHLWGLGSVIPGLLEAAIVVPDRQPEYRATARVVLDWIVKHAWLGDHFADVLQPDGSCAETQWYMVRSDAWVFNAIAAATKHLGEGSWSEVLEPCFQRMAAADFSGPESHASTRRTRAASAVVIAVKKGLSAVR